MWLLEQLLNDLHFNNLKATKQGWYYRYNNPTVISAFLSCIWVQITLIFFVKIHHYLMLVMDLTSSQQTTGSNSRECRGWGMRLMATSFDLQIRYVSATEEQVWRFRNQMTTQTSYIIAVWTTGQQTCLQLLQEGFPKRPKLTASSKRT